MSEFTYETAEVPTVQTTAAPNPHEAAVAGLKVGDKALTFTIKGDAKAAAKHVAWLRKAGHSASVTTRVVVKAGGTAKAPEQTITFWVVKRQERPRKPVATA